MTATPSLHSRLTNSLPEDAKATLVGRLWQPGIGPTVVLAADGALHDASSVAATVSQLLNLADPVGALRSALGAGKLPRVASLDAVLANGDEGERNSSQPWLLAPCDLQTIKASGVTFVSSLLERVIEEQARGDASRQIHPATGGGGGSGGGCGKGGGSGAGGGGGGV